jgi:hypothetical protein
MRSELAVLYRAVVAGEVASVEEFRSRLEAIESLQPDLDPELNVGRAVRAFSALEHEAPSRHHQFELIQAALGIA